MLMKKHIVKVSITFIICLLLIFLKFQGEAFPAASTNYELPAPDKIHYAPLQFILPQTQRVVLENGIVLYVLENHELPLVNINALIKTGTMYDPEGKAGVAELTAYVMRTGGTAKLNSAEIDNRFDFMAASASISMSMESAQVNFSILNKNLDRGLDLLAQILIYPAFEQNKFELARQLKNEELRRLKDDTEKLAFREFNRLIYANDPRGRFSSYKSLANIKRDDLIEFHGRFFLPNNIIFAVSGDITREEAVNKFRQYFGDWKAKDILANIPSPSQKSNTGIYYINKEIPQSTIISGQFAASKNDPDFYAFTVLDFITGSGGFPSRIFSAVRNNEGLAYSAGSFYRAKPAYGIFGTYAFTKTSSTMKTLSLINSVLENIQSGTITAKEIDWARNSIKNGFVFSFDTPEQIAWQQMNLEYEKLPADFLINYRRKIEEVSIKDLNNVAAKYLDKTKNVVLILGDSKKFDKPLTTTEQYIVIIPEE
ncbi:MAG: pitrilysin family protein [Deltaproteobacteria bacterium]|nr:pitrilysin family protein [Deltaproteobacteria bacterium]